MVQSDETLHLLTVRVSDTIYKDWKISLITQDATAQDVLLEFIKTYISKHNIIKNGGNYK